MPTQNPRINITLDKEFLGIISKLAARDHVSVSAKTRQLVLAALELDEDVYFSRLAERREKNHKKWFSHEEAWK